MRDIDDFGEALTSRGVRIITLARQMQGQARELPAHWEETVANWQRMLGIDPPTSRRQMYPWSDASDDEITSFATSYFRVLDHAGEHPVHTRMTPDKFWGMDRADMEASLNRRRKNAIRRTRAANAPRFDPHENARIEAEIARVVAAEAAWQRRLDAYWARVRIFESIAAMEMDHDYEQYHLWGILPRHPSYQAELAYESDIMPRLGYLLEWR